MLKQQSPDYAKISHATAISLGLARGKMYRGAVNRCVNLLVHYPEGCSANCAYCGLAKKRPGNYKEKSFIHVEWPVFSMDRIVDAINGAPSYVKRTCISMITNGKCTEDTIHMTKRLRTDTMLPVSVLISPTIMERGDLAELKRAGADKIGVAIDLATEELFSKYRGEGVSGPHKWEKYWNTMESSVDLFGRGNVGAHIMVGMGETEQQMVALMAKLRRMGVMSHLFSFFAEEKSALTGKAQPPWPTYLRVQLARYIMEEGLAGFDDIKFDSDGRIAGFGLSDERISEIIRSGIPFMTTGCLGDDGKVACNRPFGNCLPDVKQWNYPYEPNDEEKDLIQQQILEQN